MTDKPRYVVPSMTEIARIPWNGLSAVSTFSGCGGSSLGYKLAGFRVLWASEFIPAAQEVYRLNHPKTKLDTRDVREVKGSDIFAATGLGRGEIDLLDGSPPCSDFSTAGKRSAGWGKTKSYSSTRQRVDDLFFEFARLVDEVRPKAFIAENVYGLVKGTAKGYFKEIFRRLTSFGYRVEAQLLDAQWLGVPQARKRIIICGARSDLQRSPAFPTPFAYRYSIAEALDGLDDTDDEKAKASIRQWAIGDEWLTLAPGGSSKKYFSLVRPRADLPSPTITMTAGRPGAAGVTHPHECRRFTIAELRRICSFPDDFVLTGTWFEQWERLGRAVPPLMMRAIASAVRDRILS